MFVVLFSYFLWAPRTLGPGLKATAGCARAGPPAAALWPGPWFQATKTENSIDNICKNVQMMWLDCFTLFTSISYYFHICFTCWCSRPRSGHQKQNLWHIPGHTFFIWFSCFCTCMAWAPVYPAIFEGNEFGIEDALIVWKHTLIQLSLKTFSPRQLSHKPSPEVLYQRRLASEMALSAVVVTHFYGQAAGTVRVASLPSMQNDRWRSFLQ